MTNTDKTSWSCSATAGSDGAAPTASLTMALNGATAAPTVLKGLCYSPCPINAANSSAPNLGDWFWDSYTANGWTINDWAGVWQNDLPKIRALGVNAIRVYSMLSRQLNPDGTYPAPPYGHEFQHTAFLDACWNGGQDPLYVLVGIPLPQAMFWKSVHDQTPASQITFWESVLAETVAQVAGHPAVMGFIIQNEWDSGVVTYGSDTTAVTFWWDQVEAMAQAAKAALGTNQKLVGMAVHDDPNICGQAATYMAGCTSMDFWGVNSYQQVNFDPVFGAIPNIGPGYAGLTGAALKPVILTEWGVPATGHKVADDPSTIYADSATEAKAATNITNVIPEASPSAQPLCLGLFYFEYCDEWWNQAGSPNIYTWYGGPAAPGFPNGFWDQDGFGLYAVGRGFLSYPNPTNYPLPNDAPTWTVDPTSMTQGPVVPLDRRMARTPTIDALTTAFASFGS
ncbi:hypothetical protein HHL28_12320 [Aerophototrophica crusticola]|uniref:Glycoside hydrolase family 5 domain-containing protein n=1 Tax=Aerophototrophica crusticola TaxID=1709002 RepID=A0A858R8R1_9PROT|nr:hypothetical protein HHL28_12320 [Rhodospirillaceae bacterium B3]